MLRSLMYSGLLINGWEFNTAMNIINEFLSMPGSKEVCCAQTSFDFLYRLRLRLDKPERDENGKKEDGVPILST